MHGLYVVTPDWDDTDKLLYASEQALLGGATVLQYRHKYAGPEQRHEQGSTLQALCRRYHVVFIVNDHVDLCLELDADGVHVGETDTPVSQVRAALGPEKIIGASCYASLERAAASIHAGANYIAFGGFYPTRVKQYPATTPLDLMREARACFDVPICVLGGMTAENALPLIERGTDMVAVINSIYGDPDPGAMASRFVDVFKAHYSRR